MFEYGLVVEGMMVVRSHNTQNLIASMKNTQLSNSTHPSQLFFDTFFHSPLPMLLLQHMSACHFKPSCEPALDMVSPGTLATSMQAHPQPNTDLSSINESPSFLCCSQFEESPFGLFMLVNHSLSSGYSQCATIFLHDVFRVE